MQTLLILTTFLIKFIAEFKFQENLTHEYKYSLIHTLFKTGDPHGVMRNKEESYSAPVRNFETKNDLFNIGNVDLPPGSSMLDLTDFKWKRNNPSLCSVGGVNPSEKILLVLVHTARGHYMERLAIRNTWASIQNYRNWTVCTVFLIGESAPNQDDPQQELELDDENQQYGDLITGNFIDSYRNLTYKHIMGYKWALEHCSNAAFVLKTDDDMFVDVLHFIDQRVDKKYANAPDIYCYTFTDNKPIRSKSSKWYVTEEEWPESTYPTYCSGWGYGITVNWINKLYLMSSQTQYFWVDDVFIGILMNMAISFFHGEPQIQTIHDWYTFDNRKYIEMCRNYSIDETSLKVTERKFGSIVYINRDNEFRMEMECLWRKTILDKDGRVE